MLYREIIAVCSEIQTKHINTLCGLNLELLNVKLLVLKVTAGLQTIRGGPHFKLSFTPCCFNATCQFTAILSLRPPIFGLTAFGWPRNGKLPSCTELTAQSTTEWLSTHCKLRESSCACRSTHR